MSHLWIFIVLGLTAGGAYAITAVGIVTTYRGSGVLNFAQCAIGMIGAYTFFSLRYGDLATLPTPVAILAGVVASGVLGIVMYLLIMRPLLQAVELAKVVATIGVLLVLQGLATIHWGTFPRLVDQFLPAGGVRLGSASLSYSTLVMLIALTVVTILLWGLFRFSRLGLSAVALQERPDAAKVLGISPLPTGVIVWGLGGALAAIAAILLLPVTQLSPSQATTLLFPAFAAGLFGRFRSYGATVAAGLLIGIFESVLIGYNWPTYLVNAIPFGIIIIALVLGGSSIPGRGLLTARLPKLGNGRPRPVMILVGFALAVGTVAWSTEGWAIAITSTAISGLIGLSIVVATGYAGQITLLPFALAGLSALVSVHIANSWHFPFLASVVVGLAVGAVSGALAGLPAIRVRGLDLAVATLGMALVLETSIFTIPRFTNDNQGLSVPSPSLFGFSLDATVHEKRFAVMGIVVFALASLAVLNLRRSRSGRRLVSVRGNERGAAALGISVAGAKVGAFAFSGALAGLAGILFLYRSSILDLSTGFDSFSSMTALGFVIVGGVGMVAGGIFAGILAAGGVGAYWFRNDSSIDEWLIVLSGVFVIYVMLTHPDGEADRLVSIWRRVSARFAPLRGRLPAGPRILRRASSSGLTVVGPGADPDPLDKVVEPVPVGPTVLTVEGLSVKYGSVVAVSDVGLAVSEGSVLGVIGPNGAGKTSLVDAITGFTRAAGGHVRLRSQDVTGWRAVRRARAGLGRTFQNMELFVELSVRENLLAAADARDPWAYLRNVVWPGSRQLSDKAQLSARILGIDDLYDKRIEDLPTGTQRLVSIARAVAANAEVLCLDEPSAGLNEAERAAFGRAIKLLIAHFNLGILMIEHNVDVVAEVCHDVMVLDFGRVVAMGPTSEVLRSDIVREAYLGESANAADASESLAAAEGTS
jgi:ABC-type branched-subunit amino acid transport system ATPase component/branched-subunit amino acid ABC-type transport system permease component